MRQPSVVIIGAGMTGILAVIKLRQQGINDIVVLEKTAAIGGTWRDNTYPGVACDVPSHMYTYSFEPNPNWSKFFASGNEINRYFEQVANKYSVPQAIRFNQEAVQAVYNDHRWQVTTNTGEQYQADFLIGATGILHHPATPNIKGLESFKGNLFHTARWQHQVPVDSSQRIGVIGTGATAAQAIPELIDAGAQVSVFQRTAQWLAPGKNFHFSEATKRRAANSPKLQWLLRAIPKFLMEHIFTKAVTGRPLQKQLLNFLCNANLRVSVKDRRLRKKLTPDYQVGCKRVIINDSFYKAIQKDNASLITDAIDQIDETGVITQDGKHHPLDTLVLATGFNAMAFVRPLNLVGQNGLTFDQAWRTQIRSYRSLLIKGFPNFFLMLGPNTPIGNFSVIAMAEVQIDYLLKLIKQWQLGEFESVQPTAEAVEQFTQSMKQGLKGTAWVGGCSSWYLNTEGDPILWPYTWQRWVDEMATPNPHDLTFN